MLRSAQHDISALSQIATQYPQGRKEVGPNQKLKIQKSGRN
jgi:hypothetical protein